MTSNVARVVMISAALAGTAALAQTDGAGSLRNTSTYQPVHKATAPAADQPVDMFVTKQSVTEWRAPKLVGVSVYGVDDKKVGTIKDVLIDHDGSARVIVIGVDRAKIRSALHCDPVATRVKLCRQRISHSQSSRQNRL